MAGGRAGLPSWAPSEAASPAAAPVRRGAGPVRPPTWPRKRRLPPPPPLPLSASLSSRRRRRLVSLPPPSSSSSSVRHHLLLLFGGSQPQRPPRNGGGNGSEASLTLRQLRLRSGVSQPVAAGLCGGGGMGGSGAREEQPPSPAAQRALVKGEPGAGVRRRHSALLRSHVTQRIMTKEEKPLFRFLASSPAPPGQGGTWPAAGPAPFKGAAASGKDATLHGASRSGSRCGCDALSCRSPTRGFCSAAPGLGALPADQRGSGRPSRPSLRGAEPQRRLLGGGVGSERGMPSCSQPLGRVPWSAGFGGSASAGSPFPSKAAPRVLRGALGRGSPDSASRLQDPLRYLRSPSESGASRRPASKTSFQAHRCTVRLRWLLGTWVSIAWVDGWGQKQRLRGSAGFGLCQGSRGSGLFARGAKEFPPGFPVLEIGGGALSFLCNQPESPRVPADG